MAKKPIQITKASAEDVQAIHDLLLYYAEKELILYRSKEEISSALDHFWVAKQKTEVVGAISYFDYGYNLKEIRSLAVKENCKHARLGSRLVSETIEYLHENAKPRIFVLTYSPDFFEKNGFKITPKDTLPEKIWKDCATCKNQDHCTETALIFA